MFISKDKNYLYIFLLYFVLTTVYLIAEYVITGNQFGFPLDDTWIHFHFSENFSGGYFFQYNIGMPTPGTSSPLWVIILSIPFFISEKFVLPFSLAAGSLFFLLTCFELYRLCLRIGLSKHYSLLITILTLISGRLLWSSLSGMEITLFCYLSVLIFKIHLRELETGKISVLTGLFLGLAVITRPETYLLALIYFIYSVIHFKNNLSSNSSGFVLSLIIFLAIALPYPVFSYYHTGKLLPNTFQGQNAGLRFLPDMTYVIESAKLFFKDNLMVLFLWIISSLYFIYTIFRRKAEGKLVLINLWVIMLPVVSAFLTPNWRHHGRYLIPLIPFINIVAINILAVIYSAYKAKSTKLLRTAVTTLLILASLVYAVVYANALGWNVDNINNQQVRIAHWLNANLPEERIFGTNDIGAITCITKRRVVDMAGLVTPEILRFQKMRIEDGNRNLLLLLKNSGVNYIIIYPHWYEYIMQKYYAGFEQVYSARLVKNTICGGIEMYVFKINWDKIDLSK